MNADRVEATPGVEPGYTVLQPSPPGAQRCDDAGVAAVRQQRARGGVRQAQSEKAGRMRDGIAPQVGA